MSKQDEEKQEDETVEEVEETTEVDESEESDKESEDETTEDKPDYKALLEQEQTKSRRLSGALKEAREEKRTVKEEKKEEVEKVENEADGKTLTESDIRRIMREERLDLALSSKVTDPDKRKLVRHYLDNRINPSASIDDDVDLALYAVDRKVHEAQVMRKAKKRVAEEIELAREGGKTRTIKESDESLSSSEKESAGLVKMDKKKFKKYSKLAEQFTAK